MGWSIAFDDHWKRDIGYGVPAVCDHPDCNERIDRGLSHVCAGEEPRGGEGCGLYFCDKHHDGWIGDPDAEGAEVVSGACERCANGEESFGAKPDLPAWTAFKMTDKSWAAWREENGHPEPTESDIKAAQALLDADGMDETVE